LTSEPTFQCGQGIPELLADKTVYVLRSDAILNSGLGTSFKHDDRLAAADRPSGSPQRVKFSALNIKLDERQRLLARYDIV
jgi:hypothetical protein